MSTAQATRTKGFVWCGIAYLVAGAVAVITALALPDRHPLETALWADVAATIAIFAFSVAFRNSSFYDAYWSIAPPVIALYLAFGLSGAYAQAPLARQLLVITLVSAWAARLTWNWARGWSGLDHEDWRYINIRETTGAFYWPSSFAGIHMMPTLMVFAGCLPLLPALATGTQPLGPLDALAAVVTGGAIWLEGTADNQLRAFRLGKPAPEAILETGLWARCRHPNYLGEILFWWGLFLFALAAAPGSWWTGLGAVSITLLFRFASLRMIDTRMLERRPGYQARLESTPALIPRFWRT